MGWFGRKYRSAGDGQGLEHPLRTFGDAIPFNLRMATEGVFTCAELGWGKTWLVFLRFLREYLRVMGGWILGAKPEDLEMVLRLFEQERAGERLTVLRPGDGNCINWLQGLAGVAPQGAATEEVVGGLESLMEIERRSAGSATSDSQQFFKTHAMQLLSAIVTTLRLASEELTAMNIYRFLVSLPQSANELGSSEWRERSYANQCIAKAHVVNLTEKHPGDLHHAKLYLLNELVDLDPRTRSSIVSAVSAMLSKMLRGWMGTMWSTTTTVDLARAFQGHWFYFDTSPLEFSEYGVSSLVMAKHLIERMVMRRRIDADARAVALMFDEAQNIFVTADRDYQAVCRSKLSCNWVATQNLTGLFAALGGGQAAESIVKSWLALFGCKIFGANADWDSNTYASQICGQTLQNFGSWNLNGDRASMWDTITGVQSQLSSGMQERFEPACRPELWVRLRKPVPPKFEAEAIVVMTRLQQSIGRHWTPVTFVPE